MNSTSIYYVYMYLDTENVPFYIGKGCNYRYNVKIHLNENHKNPFLKNKILKVGKENVKIHFLHENLTEEESFRWEEYWIKYIGRRDKKEGTLCNLTDGGDGATTPSTETRNKLSKSKLGSKNPNYGKPATNLGIPHTEKTKQKISKAKKGKLVGEYNPFFGKTHSDEFKKQQSARMKGKPAWNKGIAHSNEAKVKISKRLKGKSARNKGILWSNEVKQKISKANKGKVPSEITKQRMSAAQKGRKHSIETKQKMRIAALKRWSKNAYNK